MLGAAPPALGQTSVTLVSNIGQSNPGTVGQTVDNAQRFTTGSNSAGYVLTGIDVVSADPQGDSFNVSVCEVNSSGFPTSDCTQLTAPGSFAAGTLAFTASPGIPLMNGTTYTIVLIVVDQRVSYGITSSDGEDPGAADGWSLQNASDQFSRVLGWQSQGTHSFRVAIKGYANTPADDTAPTVSSATVDGTSLVITFDENLAAATNLANSAFTVKKTPSGGNEETVTLSGTPAISNDTVTLTLAAAVLATDTDIKVTYTVPTSGTDNTLKDAAGNEVVTFTDQPVTNNTNNAPTVMNEIPDQIATAGTAFSYTFPATTFTDADSGDMLTYTAVEDGETGLPTWLNFNAATRTFSGTPGASDVETLTVTVTASDGTDSVTDTFDIVVSAAAASCPAPTGRRTIWTGEVTVGEGFLGGTTTPHFYGFSSSSGTAGALSDTSFTIGANEYIIDLVRVLVDSDLQFSLTSSGALTAAEVAALRLHVCDTGYDFSSASYAGGARTYTWAPNLDWSSEATVTLHLSLPANNAATGQPAITGTATVGEELTATTGTIADTDGLPSSYEYQWIREDADGMNPEDITGETSSTYTLTTDDAGKKIKVRVSFTDALGGAEARTSDRLPRDGHGDRGRRRLPRAHRPAHHLDRHGDGGVGYYR